MGIQKFIYNANQMYIRRLSESCGIERVIFYPHKFLKTRPKSLGGLGLELDGYNKELNIAFEYDGIPYNVNNMEQFITESHTLIRH